MDRRFFETPRRVAPRRESHWKAPQPTAKEVKRWTDKHLRTNSYTVGLFLGVTTKIEASRRRGVAGRQVGDVWKMGRAVNEIMESGRYAARELRVLVQIEKRKLDEERYMYWEGRKEAREKRGLRELKDEWPGKYRETRVQKARSKKG